MAISTFTMNKENRAVTAAWKIGLIVMLALALRLVNLNSRPLWYDEAFTLLHAEQPLARIFYGTVTQSNGAAADVHPLFFYNLLHVWMSGAGQSPFSVRLLSVVLGTATVIMVYLLARRLFDERSGLIAAVLTAVAPFHVYYSQEIRMYSLLGLTTISMTYFFVRAWREGDYGNWVAFAVLAALTLYTHNLGAMFLAGLALWVLWTWQRGPHWLHWRPLVWSHLLILLLYVPWLTILPGQFNKIQQAFWITRPGLVELIQTVLVFHFSADNQALPGWLVPLALFFGILLPIVLLLEMNRRRQANLPSSRFPAPVSLLLFLTIAPVLLTFLVSQVRPVYVIRALLPSALSYYILVAGVLFARLTPKPVQWGLMAPAALIVLLSLLNHYTYTGFPRSSFAEVGRYLHQHVQTPEDVIVHSNKLTFFPTHYYDRVLTQTFIGDEPGSSSDNLAYATQESLGLFAQPDLETAVAGHRRVWLVIFDRALEEYEEAGNQHPHLAWLEQHYELVNTTKFNDLSVYTYAQP